MNQLGIIDEDGSLKQQAQIHHRMRVVESIQSTENFVQVLWQQFIEEIFHYAAQHDETERVKYKKLHDLNLRSSPKRR